MTYRSKGSPFRQFTVNRSRINPPSLISPVSAKYGTCNGRALRSSSNRVQSSLAGLLDASMGLFDGEGGKIAGVGVSWECPRDGNNSENQRRRPAVRPIVRL